MPRVAIPVTIIDVAGNALSGKSVTVRKRSDSSLASLFTTETGGTSAANPLSTDANGRVTGWVDRGAYKLTISGSGITTYDENFDAIPGQDGGIDIAALAGSVMPLGSIVGYGGASDPAGGFWLICDGRALSRVTYAALFAAVGVTFGVGDGSTTFNLPDFRGRVLLGAGTGSNPTPAGATAHSLGAKGGEETHALSIAELAAHGHTVSDPQHRHQLAPSGGVALTSGGANLGTGQGLNATGTDSLSGLSATGVTVQNTGSGSGHNTLPPFTTANRIIRAL